MTNAMITAHTDGAAMREAPVEDFFAFRRRLLHGILLTMAILGLPALAVGGLEALKLGQRLELALYAAAYAATLLTVIARHRLPYRWCAMTALGSLYLIAVINLARFAYAGAGIELLLAVSLLSTILSGTRTGLIATVAGLVPIIAAATAYLQGMMPAGPNLPTTIHFPVVWLTAAAVYLLLSGSLVLSAGMLQGHLLKTIETVRQQTADLASANTELAIEAAERKQAEHRLKQSEKRFRTLFEEAPDAIYLNDFNGMLIDGNQAAERLIGASRESLIGKDFFELNLLPSSEIPKALANLERNMAGNPTGPDEITLVNTAGKDIPVEIRTYPVSLDDETVVMGIARDVSERKHLEKQLRQSQKLEAIGTLAGGIAHDFNNILSSIMGYAELAVQDANNGSEQADNLGEVLIACDRAKELVRQILTFARQSNKEIKPISVKHVAGEALKLMRSSIPTNIDIRTDIRSHSLVMGNATEVHQVILNLCTNAAHAMDTEAGVLSVSIEDISLDAETQLSHSRIRAGDYIRLRVADTGRGIGPDIIDAIFEPYFTTKETGEGTGLGLAVVQGIVDSYGGHISVDSRIGEGTVFDIFFPVTSRTADAGQRRPSQSPVGREHILFVDDELPIVKLNRRMLEGLGYRVTARTSSVEALALFNSKSRVFDLVITDMTMPNMTGDQLAAEISHIRPEIPIILCTGYSKRLDGVQNAPGNIRAVVHKPISKSELATAIRRVLDAGRTD